ncbi:MAG: PEP-CTERM sorting domain-containing protein [Alphaproteobacteria bacterium]
MRSTIAGCSLAFGAFLLIDAPSAHATVITYGVPGSLTPGYSGATVITFDALTLGPVNSYNFGDGTLTGDGAVVQGSVVNRYAAPVGDLSQYFTVGYAAPVGSATFAFNEPLNYFGLYWGSIDAYNSIAFELNGIVIASYTGDQLPAPIQANGNQQSSLSSRYVNFFLGSENYNEVVLSSTNYAFESDNIAYADPPAPVPEPSSGLLFATVLLVGSVGWRLRATSQAAIRQTKDKFRA